MTRVVILGAGIAGLSAGWLLQQSGVDFIILEKQTYPGGLARSFLWNGFSCDFAAHRLFSTNESVLQQLISFVPMGRHIRRSRIYLKGHWMRDPLDVIELGTRLSIPRRLGLLWSFYTRPRRLPDDSFENYVLRRYGKSLYELFFKPYTEKLFGLPGSDISVLWAQQKVRLANPFDNFRENTKTKFQYFYYPVRKGYGAIANHLYQQIQEKVLLNTTVTSLTSSEGAISSVRYEREGQSFEAKMDFVISTLPMSLTGKMLGQSYNLNYQKVDAVYLLINRPLVMDYHWVYFIDDSIAINRMVEFKNMSPVDTPPTTSVVCAEVTQHHPDVVGKVIDDLVRVGMIKKEEVLDTKVVHENYAYPVYDQHYEQTLQHAQQTFSQYTNLFLVGRAAEFRHREVDDNFSAALEAVQQIVQRIPGATFKLEERGRAMETTQKKGLVYVVILTYNHYEDTHECLESVYQLDATPFEVVVVDNGSSDDTPDKIRENFPKAHVIENHQNLGVPAGYNVGFKVALESGAEYILMLNNDTILAPDMLAELLAVVGSDPRCGIVMPKILYHGTTDRVWSSGGRYRAFPPAILMTDRRKEAAETTRMIEYAPSCGLLIHRQAFERAGMFDPGYFFLYDDWDFSDRVRAFGMNIWYAANAHLWHKVSTTTQGPRSPLFWRTYGASMTRFWRRHGRPAWFSLPVHVGYVIMREFLWKRNWNYWNDFWQGVREGVQKPLGTLPKTY
jgi:protoporphyrinogen oxidase/GT2 family glycosyltransferase